MNESRPNDDASVEVLVVEDSRTQAELLRRGLEKSGYQTRVAIDGTDALVKIRERLPSIVVSDIEMPEMDGYALCGEIKQNPCFRHLPVILLTQLSDPEDVIRGLDAGADNYVTKPFKLEYLLSRIGALLSDARGEQDADDRTGLEVTLGGRKYTVRSGRQQILTLLVSTFENAVEKNQQLLRVNRKLTAAQDELSQRNSELERLNSQLTSTNERMRRDLEAGAAVQRSLLPSKMPSVQAARFAWSFRPCEHLAGDFLSAFRLDDRHVGLYIVDVSGHGVAASLLSVTISRVLTPTPSVSTLVMQVREGSKERVITPPAEVLAKLNHRFPMEASADQYFTMAYGILDVESGELRYSSAGHPPIIHQRLDQSPQVLYATGFPIGWETGVEYEERTLQLQSGDRIWLYSDGICEAMNSDDTTYGTDRLLESLEAGRDRSLDDCVGSLIDELGEWVGETGQTDDVSVLGMEFGEPG